MKIVRRSRVLYGVTEDASKGEVGFYFLRDSRVLKQNNGGRRTIKCSKQVTEQLKTMPVGGMLFF